MTMYRSNGRQVFSKMALSNICAWSLFNKMLGFQPITLLKKKSRHILFSRKFWEIFKNTFSTENLRTTASRYKIIWLSQQKDFYIMTFVACRSTLILRSLWYTVTAWKVSKYGVFSGPYFLVFELNTEI